MGRCRTCSASTSAFAASKVACRTCHPAVQHDRQHVRHVLYARPTHAQAWQAQHHWHTTYPSLRFLQCIGVVLGPPPWSGLTHSQIKLCRPIRPQCASYVLHSHRYTLLILVLGIVSEPSIWNFIASAPSLKRPLQPDRAERKQHYTRTWLYPFNN